MTLKPEILSVRVPKILQYKVDQVVSSSEHKTRQEYLYNLILEDLRKRGIIKIKIMPSDRFEQRRA